MTDVAAHVLVAARRWAAERDVPSSRGVVDGRVVRLVPYLFESAEALHLALQRAPAEWQNERMAKACCAGRFTMILGIPLSVGNRILFRAILALVSDIHCCSKALLAMALDALHEPIQEVHSSVSSFRRLRNLFTHLDSVLSDPVQHGVSGAAKVAGGNLIEYGNEAEYCVHLVIDGNEVHFTCYGKARRIKVEKASFDPLWKAMRRVYETVTSHKSPPVGYPPPESLFA